MILRERELKRKKIRQGIVKCVESKSITLSPNTERTILQSTSIVYRHISYSAAYRFDNYEEGFE